MNFNRYLLAKLPRNASAGSAQQIQALARRHQNGTTTPVLSNREILKLIYHGERAGRTPTDQSPAHTTPEPA